MLLRAFFAQNVATGCAFGGFGVSVLALEARYQTSRALVEMAMALAVLMMGVLAPAVAGAIVRIGLRATMLIGVLLSIIGYVALATAPTIGLALAAVALLVGPGAAMFGSLPASILAGGWYPQAAGKAVGIANIPLFIALIPLLGLSVIGHLGLPAFFLCLAGINFLMLPLLMGVRDPQSREDVPRLAPDASDAADHPLRMILSQPIFWAIVVGDGLLMAANIASAAHIVPIATEQGTQPGPAALLLSVMGAASVLGSIFSGYFSDRYGAARTLAVAGCALSASWALIAMSGWLPVLILSMILSGVGGAAVFPPINVLVGQVFGVALLPRVLGLLGVLTLPMTFLLSPAAGSVRDITGNYTAVMVSFAGLCVVATINFLLIGRAINPSRATALARQDRRIPKQVECELDAIKLD